jgi:hypothetical protein
MDYEGKSLLESQADPQTAINTADIAILQGEVITLAYTDQICVIEAQVMIDPRPSQESSDVSQQVSLTGLDPPLYAGFGYTPDVRVELIAYNSPDLFVLGSGDNIFGIRWRSTPNDTRDALFHVLGTATFSLFSSVEVALRAKLNYVGGAVTNVDYNRTRLPSSTAENRIVEWAFDEYVPTEPTTSGVQLLYVDFYVVIKGNFGPTPTFTDTLTGGWKTQYRNFLRVHRVK